MKDKYNDKLVVGCSIIAASTLLLLGSITTMPAEMAYASSTVNTSKTTATVTPANMKTMIGMTERQARAYAGKKNYIVRIAARGTTYYMLTQEYKVNRVNLFLDKKSVVKKVVKG